MILKNKNKFYKNTGIQILTPAAKSRGEFLIVLVKILAVICGVLSICKAVSQSFAIPYNTDTVFFSVCITAFVLGILDFSRPIKYAAVISGLCIYIQYAVMYISDIKSGLYACANIAYEVIRKRFSFPIVDGFNEVNTNRDFTITLLVLFLAIILTIMLDLFINGFVSIIISILMTLFVFQFGIFFGTSISPSTYFILFASWFTGVYLSYSGNYTMRKSKVRKNRKGFSFFSQKRGTAQFLSFAVISIFFITGFLLSSFIYDKINWKIPKNNQYKYIADVKVRDSMILWFSKYKKYDTTYKISRGQLGNYGYMSGTSNSQSINITFAPFSEEPMYFKSFTGTYFKDNEWLENEDNESAEFINITADAYKAEFEKENNNMLKAKVSIQPSNENNTFSFVPYNAEISPETGLSVISDSRIDASGSNIVDFYIYSEISEEDFNKAVDDEIEKKKEEKRTELQSKGIDPDLLGDEIYNEIEAERPVYIPVEINANDEEYYNYVKEKYLTVPNPNIEIYKKICEDNGFSSDMPDLNEKIADYYKNNYTFSTTTGLLPWQTDFINYFTEETKSGNMTHFASSAVMLYRTLGIPARYAEGYVVTPDDYDNGIITDEKSSDRIFGAETDEEVKNVSLSQKSSFAWVEIYEKGYGWKPVNVTPVDVESDEYKKIQSDTSTVNFEILKPSETNETKSPSETKKENNSIKNKILIYILFALSAFVISILIGKALVLAVILNNGSYIKRINARTDILFNIINRKLKYDENLSFHEYGKIISENSKMNIAKDEINSLIYNIEKYSFSNKKISYKEYVKIKNKLNILILKAHFTKF